MREIVHMQGGQCGNQIGAKVSHGFCIVRFLKLTRPIALVLHVLKQSIFIAVLGGYLGRAWH